MYITSGISRAARGAGERKGSFLRAQPSVKCLPLSAPWCSLVLPPYKQRHFLPLVLSSVCLVARAHPPFPLSLHNDTEDDAPASFGFLVVASTAILVLSAARSWCQANYQAKLRHLLTRPQRCNPNPQKRNSSSLCLLRIIILLIHPNFLTEAPMKTIPKANCAPSIKPA